MRILTPYEKNQLLKYGISEENLVKTEVPVEYLTGFVDFLELELRVSPDVLIPRVETEELVILASKQAKEIFNQKKSSLVIVEVGVGSGAISIALAKKLQSIGAPFQIDGVDISSDALKIANLNLEKIDKTLPIKFSKSDLLSQLNINNVDLVIANLPYIPSSRIPNLDSSVKDFEPHLALDGGKDGLDLVEKLLEQAKSKLSKNGKILLELDITHDRNKLEKFAKDWKIKLVKDSNEGIYFGIFEPIINK